MSILLPESQGDASTKIKKDTSLRDLGNGAANLEIREEIRRVNEDQLYLSRIQITVLIIRVRLFEASFS